MSGELTLRTIDEGNFIECFNLKLAEGQEAFVSHPIRSLAQAYVYREQCTPFGIFCGGVMVGYVMVIYDWDEVVYNIWHLMIDERYQGRGYGEAAMRLCLDYIHTRPFGDSRDVVLTVNGDNAAAIHIYEKLGFADTGARYDDEIEMKLTLSDQYFIFMRTMV